MRRAATLPLAGRRWSSTRMVATTASRGRRTFTDADAANSLLANSCRRTGAIAVPVVRYVAASLSTSAAGGSSRTNRRAIRVATRRAVEGWVAR